MSPVTTCFSPFFFCFFSVLFSAISSVTSVSPW